MDSSPNAEGGGSCRSVIRICVFMGGSGRTLVGWFPMGVIYHWFEICVIKSPGCYSSDAKLLLKLSTFAYKLEI